MCFFSVLTVDTKKIANRFKTKEFIPQKDGYLEFNGFTFPQTPIITNENPDEIQYYNWGFLPSFAKDEDFRKFTLNARIETIHEKPSFKSYTKNRCLILSSGFYEWQWLDPKGKKKQKYKLTNKETEYFVFAGLYNKWVNKATGEILDTYTILTTVADEFMSKIHNSKKRMPIILNVKKELDWLMNKTDDTGIVKLEAEKVDS